MTGFPEQRRALTDAAFIAFGEDAKWFGLGEGVDVRVRLRTRDEDTRFGQGAIISRVTTLQVRSWEYPNPQRDDYITTDGMIWTLMEEPQLDARGVWSCAISPTAI